MKPVNVLISVEKTVYQKLIACKKCINVKVFSKFVKHE